MMRFDDVMTKMAEKESPGVVLAVALTILSALLLPSHLASVDDAEI